MGVFKTLSKWAGAGTETLFQIGTRVRVSGEHSSRGGVKGTVVSVQGPILIILQDGVLPLRSAEIVVSSDFLTLSPDQSLNLAHVAPVDTRGLWWRHLV